MSIMALLLLLLLVLLYKYKQVSLGRAGQWGPVVPPSAPAILSASHSANGSLEGAYRMPMWARSWGAKTQSV